MLSARRLLLWLVFSGLLLALLGANGTHRITLAQGATQVATQSPQSLTIDFKIMKDTPILSPGASGQWDAVSVRFPDVVLYKGTYYMFYGTFQTMTAPVGIGYATSNDGLHWTKSESNPILKGSGTGFDAFGVTRPVALVEPDGTWVLYYNAIPAEKTVFGRAIGRATAPSPDGPWTRDTTPVLEVGGAGAWDSVFIFPDSVIKDGDQYVMYYSASLMEGRATSTDGIHWTKYDKLGTGDQFAGSDPVLMPGAKGTWDSVIAWGATVGHTANGWEMFYYGGTKTSGGSNIKIGYAYSGDGINWQKYPDPVIGFDDRQAFFPNFIVNADGTYKVYFAVTFGVAATDFYLATGTITRGA